MERINVTKTFLPPLEEYQAYLEKIWQSGQLTNQGPLLLELEQKLSKRLGVERLHFVTNGTLALQIALRALDITDGEVITTPFSYVATTSAILWQGCQPVFVDVEPETLCIDAAKIEAAITDRTKAIMAVHVFGRPCDVEGIEAIAKKHNLKVVYDGAHAFGVEYKGRSLMSYGDVTTCSFHSTKVFHTIEGGAVITPNQAVSDRIDLIKRFGHNFDEHIRLGINAKASEFQAAMGLCNLEHIDDIVQKRREVVELYDRLLGDSLVRPRLDRETAYNYAYYPVLLDDEQQLLAVMARLAEQNIFPRRYFYPSLNTLPYIEGAAACPVSEDIAKRVLCLPLYVGLAPEAVERICKAVRG